MTELANRPVERALGLLAVVSESGETTLTECARAAGLAPSTALRLLRTLEQTGFVHRTDDGVFHPGHRLIQLGARALGNDSLVSLTEPALRAIAAETGESAYLCARTADDGVVYLAQAEGSRSIRHVSWVGHSLSLDGSAAGKAVRGDVPACGYSATISTIEPDVIAIAAPISSPKGVIAALSIVGPSYRIDEDRQRQLGELVLAEAHRISAELGADESSRTETGPVDEEDPA
ncbi:IclR family transcriptional regulator [Saccharopolyspora sp. NPDC002376]